MEFFDRKEEVLDVQLTQYGKYLLSVGKLKPVYYSFFDEDVDYDSQYQGLPPNPENEADTAGPSENQKDTVDRVKETPRLKVIHSVDTVTDSVDQIAYYSNIPKVPITIAGNNFNLGTGDFTFSPALVDNVEVDDPFNLSIEQPDSLQGSGTATVNNDDAPTMTAFGGFTTGQTAEFDPTTVLESLYGDSPHGFPYGNEPYKYPIPQKQNMQGIELPLGTSDYNSKFYPAFNMSFMKGELKDAIYYDDHAFGIKRIPQIEIEVTYETTLGSLTNTPNLKVVSVKDSDEEPSGEYGFVSQDGTFVSIQEDYIAINLKELNSLNFKKNFDIEVYEIEHEGELYEKLKPLRFGGANYINENIDVAADSGANNFSFAENFVEYYFNILVDNEVDIAFENEEFSSIYAKPGFAGKVIDSLPQADVDICEDDF